MARPRPSSASPGLSPRGRGKLRPAAPAELAGGSIPAWAGETGGRGRGRVKSEVYPRVGGGNAFASRIPEARGGLSPRGRGKLGDGYGGHSGRGSIPAWAGETRRRPRCGSPGWVYPRVGGGNGLGLTARRLKGGLSPRGRGKHISKMRVEFALGSIPAWAGETNSNRSQPRCSQVYPRVGGGNTKRQITALTKPGLSPRGRGKP